MPRRAYLVKLTRRCSWIIGLYQIYNFGSTQTKGNLISSLEYNSPGTSADPGAQLSPAISQSYSYDGINRLSSVSESGYAPPPPAGHP